MNYPYNPSSHKYLTQEDIEFFVSNGYLKLKSIISPEECHRYDQEVIQPALKIHANLDENDESTWFVQNNPKLKSMLTQPMISNDDDVGGGGIPIGLMVRDHENREHDCDPIPVHDTYWPALFDSERLNGILDELHGMRSIYTEDGTISISKEQNGGTNHNQESQHQRRWDYLHPGSVGWIHVRLPISLNKSDNCCSQQQDGNHNKKFYVPKNEQTWHVDGGHFSPHRLTSPEQSVILLPCLRTIDSNCGGGNTVILSGSHKHIAQLLRKSENDVEGKIGGTETGTGIERKKGYTCNSIDKSEKNGIDHHILNSYCEELANKWPEDQIVEAGPSCAGDIWLLHPFLVHSAGRNTRVVPSVQSMHDDGGIKVGTSSSTSSNSTSNVSSSSSSVDYFRLTFNIGTRWREQEPLSLPSSTTSSPQSSLGTDMTLENEHEQSYMKSSKNPNGTLSHGCMSILEWTIFQGAQ